MSSLKPLGRRRRETGSSSASSSSLRQREHTRKRLRKLFTGIRFYVIPAKLSVEFTSNILEDIEKNGGETTSDPEQSDVIITIIGMKARLLRHIRWELVNDKPLVTPDWVLQSVKQQQRLPFDEFLAIEGVTSNRVPMELHETPSPQMVQVEDTSTSDYPNRPMGTAPRLPPNPHFVPASMPKYCVQRHSPLVCANQELVMQFAAIRRARELDGDRRGALSYARAIASLKAHPNFIKSLSDVEGLPFVGPKTLQKISEYIKTGHIRETLDIQQSPYYQSLVAFSSIYGIGPTTARHLYQIGLRTLLDLKGYYERKSMRNPHDTFSEGMINSILLCEDLAKKIVREEVETIAGLLKDELDKFLPGCDYTILGGYRRGKTESNDIDIVFTHADPGQEKDALATLVKRMNSRGLITHILPPTSFSTSGGLSAFGHDETVDRLMTVFALPRDHKSYPYNPQGPKRTRRRLDLLFAPPEAYWTTIVGWTGSIMFERDIRRWAKDKKGYKFDSKGLVRRRDLARIKINNEKHLFELLDLPYIPPHWRNCDA